MEDSRHPIGKSQVMEANEIMRRYKRGKARLERRIVENEKWFQMKNEVINTNGGEGISRSAWLLNALLSKHADAMDHYPEPTVLPRERGDEPDALMLSAILPVVLEQNRYEQIYSDVWWYKIKQGTGVHGVFWNPDKDGGLGDVEIKKIDLLNLCWEPGISDIQDSKHLFHAVLWDRDVLADLYPALDLAAHDAGDLLKYVHDDAIDTAQKVLVVDWYYKKRGKLHYCKFAHEQVLFATENDPVLRQSGLYGHGCYPFVLDVLFPIEASPAGFGFIDMMRNPQELIDKLDMLILNSAAANSRPRYFISDQAAVNEKEFADTQRDFVHVTGPINPNHIQPVARQAIGAEVYTMRQQKIEELKETSGNRDTSNGGTSPGVTAASAIAAMQEAGSKLSRDMIKAGYRAFVQVCHLALELIREFYTLPKSFRIVGEDGANAYVTYAGLWGNEGRRAVFDLKVKTQKANPFSRISQNELAGQLFAMGLFRPELYEQALMVLDLMDFEGKEKLRTQIAKNGANMAQGLSGGEAVPSSPLPHRQSEGGRAQAAILQNAHMRAAQGSAPG